MRKKVFLTGTFMRMTVIKNYVTVILHIYSRKAIQGLHVGVGHGQVLEVAEGGEAEWSLSYFLHSIL
jgi:hypothetical protein